jgi:tRNA(fMet)-specific endonuclease VapC
MRYLLDTNACIRFLNGRAPKIADRMSQHAPTDIAVCAVVKAELRYGAARSLTKLITIARQRRFLDQFISLPFDDAAAETYGELRATLEALGTPIGPYDLQIAAITLTHRLTLVTHNLSEFGRVPGLVTDDWES